jgi:hypothetical protein
MDEQERAEEREWIADNQDWYTFGRAAKKVMERLGCTFDDASRRLREACGDDRIHSMKAPIEWIEGIDPDDYYFEDFEHWVVIPAIDWQKRNVLHDLNVFDSDSGDPVKIMLNRLHLDDWLNGQPAHDKPNNPRRPPISRKLGAAKEAIGAIWPDGILGGVVNDDVVRQVTAWMKARGLSTVSRDTILRAAGRK